MGERADEAPPGRRLGVQPATSSGRQRVEPRLPLVFGFAWTRSEQAGALETIERRKERSRVHAKYSFADLLNEFFSSSLKCSDC